MSSHCCVGSMRNLGDFSSQDYTLVRKDHCLALKRPHSSVHDIVAELESSIANEAKLANLARRLEALETKEPSSVNQVSPN